MAVLFWEEYFLQNNYESEELEIEQLADVRLSYGLALDTTVLDVLVSAG